MKVLSLSLSSSLSSSSSSIMVFLWAILITTMTFQNNQGIVMADLVLSEKLVHLAILSAELSSLAYNEEPSSEGYDQFEFFDEEPDQAIMAQKDGYCLVAFRGTTMTWIDWQQNFELGKEDICITDELDGIINCCSTRTGFYKAYMTSYKDELEQKIRDCVTMTCPDPLQRDECVVFTGHSQGGAIAAVAGLVMADLNPYVITFGQPATIDAPCDMISSSRWYRFVNTKSSTDTVGISYDPVPFVPGLGADSFGHFILLSEDPTGVAYIGLDAQDSFGPLNTLGFEAHSMVHADGVPYPGYMDRLQALLNEPNHTWPIRATGYKAGSLCSQGIECMSGQCASETTFSFHRCIGIECTIDDDCESGRCDSGSCIPKLGSCMPCDEDTDCEGNKCTLFHCSGSDGLMDDECICKWDSDCSSGRCELFTSGVCESKLGNGASCNEHSDCLSNYCSWSFHCEDVTRVTSFGPGNGGSGSKGKSLTPPGGDESSSDSSVNGVTPSISNSSDSTKGSKMKPARILIIIILCLMVLYYGTRFYLRRRQGYETVSTELNV